jgi:nucleotide-binding universal stress UspA family protein
MSYSTLMVHLELEHSNDARLRIAGDLAEQFDARLIGIAACDPQPPHYAGGAFAQGLVERERTEIKKKMAETEERFRTAVQNRAPNIEWRSAMTRPTDYVAREARAADLVITGASREAVFLDPLRRLDASDLLMQAGRPIFVVPPEAEHLKLKNVLVAWKDTREARRAVADALPLLQRAEQVHVVEVIEDDSERTGAQERVNDVVEWLGRHTVAAFDTVIHAATESEQLDALWQNEADLVVAGAYGHTRFREWVLGGFTRNLLTRSRRCSFLAH